LNELADFSATKGQVATTTEENMERLADAGFLVEDLIPVCFNCNTKGHGKSECPDAPEGTQLASHFPVLLDGVDF
jgi:hypothetical protein